MNPYLGFFALFILLAIAALVTFEVLLWRLHWHYPIEWVREGSPYTLFSSSASGFFRGSVARWRLGFKWLLATPDWIRLDRTTRWLFRAYRYTALLHISGFFIFLIAALLLS